MARLEKLMIQGVRSFSPSDKNILEFHVPLTLIVGANGTGKTTIIECLKYITTGEMPPNSRGGAFIYDPKIAREIDVKAEIRLKFINNKGETLVCTRSMQSTLKKGKTEQKTLETNLSKDIGGQNVLLASKLADIDRDIPRHLGVGHSILENVILCHQDESTWPLGDPTVMKKKLDDIFCSTKYNKALLGLKNSKKEINTDLKLKEQRLSFLLKDKIKRDELLKSISFYNSESDKKKQKLKLFIEELQRIDSNIDMIGKELDVFCKLEQNYKALNVEFEYCKNFIKNFGYEILPDNFLLSRDGILESIKTIESELCEHGKINIEIEFSRVENLRRKAIEEHLKNSRILSEIGGLEDKLNDLRAEQNSVVSFLTEEFSCSENVILEKSKEAFESVRDKIREKSGELDKMRESLFAKRNEQAEIKRKIDENSAFVEKYKNLVRADIDVDSKIEIDYDRQMELECYIDELMEELNAKQEGLNERYKLSERSFKKVHLLENMNEIEEEIKQENLEDLKRKLHTKGDLLSRCKEALKLLEREHHLKENFVIQKKENNSKILDEIKSLLGKLEQNGAISGKENIKNKNTIENLDDVENYFLSGVLDYEPLKSTEAFEKELEECKSIIVASNYASSVYLNFCKLGEKKKECPLCKKGLNCNEKTEFVSRLEKVIAKLPESIKNAETKKESLEATIAETNKLNLEIDQNNQVKCEIKKLFNEIETATSICNLERDLLKQKKEIDVKESEIKHIEQEIVNLNYKDEKIKNYCSQLLEMKKEYDDLPDNVDIEPFKLSLENTKSLLETKKSELSSINYDIERKEKRLKEIEVEKENRKKLAERDNKIDQNKILKEKIRENIILDLEEAFEKKSLKVENLEKKFIRKKLEVEMKIKKLEEIRNLTVEISNKISGFRSEIRNDNSYVIFDSKKVTAETLKDDQEFEKIRSVILEHKNNIIKLNKDLEREKMKLRTTEENIKLRKLKQRALDIEEELKNFDIKKFTILKEKLTSYSDKKLKTTNNESVIKGELKQITQTIKNLASELDTGYKDTLTNFLRCTIEIKTLELSLEDLDKCINALDKSIVDFHRSKIEEINRLLRELWANTYKGNDIEYIELKSESSESRAYNYRIVMIKNGVELDMRGRSSAGQKMIASILFRIVLADSFSCGCNVLALDEPTTNLDRDNIESLASSLSQIIKERSNVQMIVITHDEEFVQMLNREGVEYFYRLRRDSHGNSHIERHSIY